MSGRKRGLSRVNDNCSKSRDATIAQYSQEINETGTCQEEKGDYPG